MTTNDRSIGNDERTMEHAAEVSANQQQSNSHVVWVEVDNSAASTDNKTEPEAQKVSPPGGAGEGMKTSSPQRSPRDPYWDNAKIYLVINVCVGHFLEIYMPHGKFPNVVVRILYVYAAGYIMPSFCMISGYFSNRTPKDEYTTFKQSNSLLRGLFVPYVIFQVIYSLMYHFLYEKPDQKLPAFGPQVQSNYVWQPFISLWFLMSLITWRLVGPHYMRVVKYPLITSIVIGLLAGYSNATRFLSLQRSLAYFPFFVFGWLMKDSEPLFTHVRRKCYTESGILPSKHGFMAIGFCALMLVPMVFYGLYAPGYWDCPIWFGDPYWSEIGECNFPQWYAFVVRLFWYAFDFPLSIAVLLALPPFRIPHVSDKWGPRTMLPYIAHPLFIIAFQQAGYYQIEGLSVSAMVAISFFLGVAVAILLMTDYPFAFWLRYVVDPPFLSWFLLKRDENDTHAARRKARRTGRPAESDGA